MNNETHGVCPQASSRHQSTTLLVSTGIITSFTGSAIVNAANRGCLGGGGVDGAITPAGGAALAEARKALLEIEDPNEPNLKCRCPTGHAKLTVSGDLPCEFVIHAVGPNYNGLTDRDGHALLSSAYRNSMAVAKEANITSIAFSLLSAGVFRGGQSLERVLKIAVDTVRDNVWEGLEEVHFMAFKEEEKLILQELLVGDTATHTV